MNEAVGDWRANGTCPFAIAEITEADQSGHGQDGRGGDSTADTCVDSRYSSVSIRIQVLYRHPQGVLPSLTLGAFVWTLAAGGLNAIGQEHGVSAKRAAERASPRRIRPLDSRAEEQHGHAIYTYVVSVFPSHLPL